VVVEVVPSASTSSGLVIVIVRSYLDFKHAVDVMVSEFIVLHVESTPSLYRAMLFRS